MILRLNHRVSVGSMRALVSMSPVFSLLVVGWLVVVTGAAMGDANAFASHEGDVTMAKASSLELPRIDELVADISVLDAGTRVAVSSLHKGNCDVGLLVLRMCMSCGGSPLVMVV